MAKVKIRVLKLLPGFAIGDEVEVDSDQEGTLFDDFWRRRLKDAERDDCCEIVKPTGESSEPVLLRKKTSRRHKGSE